MRKKDKIKFNCDFCGKESEKVPCNYHKSKHHFCDLECSRGFYSGKESPYYKGVKFNCEWCGKENYKQKSQYDINKKHFCSLECWTAYRKRDNIETSCSWCGSDFTMHRSAYNVSAYHFCNKKCKDQWHSVQMTGESNPAYVGDYELICDNCGVEYTKSRRRYNLKEGQKTFCTRKCEGQWNSKHRVGKNAPCWKGGVTPIAVKVRNSKKNLEWRVEVFKRDNYTCQDCGDRNQKGLGRTVYVQVDHIKEFNIIMRENNISTLLEAYGCEELWNIDNGKTLCIDCHNEKPIKIYKEAI